MNVDPNDNNYVYAESQFGNLGRSTDGGNNFAGATDGISSGDRNNWNTPVVLSPFNSEKAFYGTNKLYISDRAVLWNVISPDLTDGQHPSGSLSYGTLTSIAPSYINLSTIYTGSDDGNVYVTFDGGSNWSNISAGLPDRYITSIAIASNDDNTAYVTFSGYTTLDYTAHIYKTIDGGQNWIDISSNLPSIPVNDIVVSDANNLLFVATDLNVWYSANDGASWDILGNDLPFNIIRDLKIHEPTNILYAGTFGRSMHSYDIGNIVLNMTDNLFISKEIKLYPNPAQTEFTIEHNIASEGVVKLYDISGKEIRTLFEGDFGKNSKITISTEGIASGLYFIKLQARSQSVNQKLIIQ